MNFAENVEWRIANNIELMWSIVLPNIDITPESGFAQHNMYITYTFLTYPAILCIMAGSSNLQILLENAAGRSQTHTVATHHCGACMNELPTLWFGLSCSGVDIAQLDGLFPIIGFGHVLHLVWHPVCCQIHNYVDDLVRILIWTFFEKHFCY